MTDTLMFDGINSLAAGIARQFPGAAKIAGYVDGIYAWSQAEWDLFPHADHVKIAVRASTNAGDVLDVENGDATPAEAAAWIRMRHAAGLFRPTVYCSLSVVPDIRRETGSLILGVDYDIWVAEYTARPTPPPCPGLPAASFAAWQYESTAGWDASRVLDPAWPHRQPAHPAPLPAPIDPTGTATDANIAWHTVSGATGYRAQVRDGAGAAKNYLAGAATVWLNVPLTGPGPHSWRVQADGGAWTSWLAVS